MSPSPSRTSIPRARNRWNPCLAESSCLRIEITNFLDTNRISIAMPDDCISACALAQEVVHAIVEIRVLASRTVSALNHQFRGPNLVDIPSFREEIRKANGHNRFAGCFLAGSCVVSKSTGKPCLTSCSGQVCTRWLVGVHASKRAHALQLE